MRSPAVLVIAVMLAGCGGVGAPRSDEGEVKVADGVRSISKTDPKTSLRFEIQTAGPSTMLTIAATNTLPAGVRTQLEGKRISATCAVAGVTVAPPLAQAWPDLATPFHTTLQTKRPVPVADRATTCTLRIAGTAGAPFSQVKLR